MAGGSERDIVRVELRWALAMGALSAAILAVIVFTAIAMGINPPSNAETIDPKTLHRSGEFTEANLGTSVDPGGQVVTRMIATQFAFVPQCVVVPEHTPVTMRFTTPDVIHGILVTGTNVNTMVVPGYISQVHTTFTKAGDMLMPCQEYCGFGHSSMIAHVRVVPKDQFRPGPDGKISCG